MDTSKASLSRTRWQPGTSGNQIVKDGDAITKSFCGRLGAFAREQALLLRLESLSTALPIPRLLSARRFGELRYAYLDGIPADQAIEAGLVAQTLTGMGYFLRCLHGLDPVAFADVLPGDGPVVAHGDFAPYNVLVHSENGALVAVLDWEEARRDDPALDLAWCEAQFLARHPHFAAAIRHLHAAYGEVPSHAQREQALARRLEGLNALAASARMAGAKGNSPREEVLHRCAFDTREEAAAFVAALSRQLAGQACGIHHAAGVALVWADTSADKTVNIYLTAESLRAVEVIFGERADVTVLDPAEAPTNCQLLYGAGDIPAWGMEAALQALSQMTNNVTGCAFLVHSK